MSKPHFLSLGYRHLCQFSLKVAWIWHGNVIQCDPCCSHRQKKSRYEKADISSKRNTNVHDDMSQISWSTNKDIMHYLVLSLFLALPSASSLSCSELMDWSSVENLSARSLLACRKLPSLFKCSVFYRNQSWSFVFVYYGHSLTYISPFDLPVSLCRCLHQQQHAAIPVASLEATPSPIGSSGQRRSPIGWENQTVLQPHRSYILTN